MNKISNNLYIVFSIVFIVISITILFWINDQEKEKQRMEMEALLKRAEMMKARESATKMLNDADASAAYLEKGDLL